MGPAFSETTAVLLRLACRVPPTLSLYVHHQDDVYRFPYTEVCFFVDDNDEFSFGAGCDPDIDWDRCLGTVVAKISTPCGYEPSALTPSPAQVSS